MVNWQIIIKFREQLMYEVDVLTHMLIVKIKESACNAHEYIRN
jgi:hypothetical protein